MQGSSPQSVYYYQGTYQSLSSPGQWLSLHNMAHTTIPKCNVLQKSVHMILFLVFMPQQTKIWKTHWDNMSCTIHFHILPTFPPTSKSILFSTCTYGAFAYIYRQSLMFFWCYTSLLG